jgi:hypothetical protein
MVNAVVKLFVFFLELEDSRTLVATWLLASGVGGGG